jgi:outer membrane lipoprotein-sorting protein
MKRLACLWLSVVLLSAAACAGDEDKKAADELKDPLEIMKKADAACKTLKSVKYDVTSEPSAELKAIVARVQAAVVAAKVAGKKDASAAKFVFDARVNLPNQSEADKVTFGTDLDKFFFIDHQTKKVHEDMDEAVLGRRGMSLYRSMMIEYMHPTPFDDEIKAKSRELRGSKTISGVDCYEIHVVYAAEEAPEATWYIGKKDFLPRGRADHVKTKDGKTGKIEKMISKLEVDPKLPDDAFKARVPDGYTKTDEFAP